MVYYTAIRVHNTVGLIRRSGVISIINLIPLSVGAYMNFLTNAYGIRLGVYGRIHRWLGRVAVVEGLVYAIAAVSLQKPDLYVLSDIAGLIVSLRSNSGKEGGDGLIEIYRL